MKSLVYKNGYQIKEDICLFCPDLIKMDNEIRTWTRSGTSDHYYDWTEDWVGVEYHPIEPFYEFSITSSKEDREKILNHIDSSYDEFLRSKNSDLKNILYKKISLQKPVQKIDFSQHTEGIVNNLLKFYKEQLEKKKKDAKIILTECLDIDESGLVKSVSQKTQELVKMGYPYHRVSESYTPAGTKCHVACWPFGEFKDLEMFYERFYEKIHLSHLTNIIKKYNNLFDEVNLFDEIKKTKISLKAKQARLVIN